MPFLVVGGVTVDVAMDGVTRDVEEIGERARMFDGTMRSTIRAQKQAFHITTVPLGAAASSSLTTQLNGAQPVACSGDLTGAANFFTQWEGDEVVNIVVAGVSTPFYVNRFTLFQV